MRSHLLHRTIIGAAALALLASSAVAAQSDSVLPTDTRFPDEVGPTLRTWVITNALDDEGSGALIADTVSAYQKELGGVTKDPTRSNDDKKNKNSNEGGRAPGGLMIEPPARDTEAVTQALLDATGRTSPTWSSSLAATARRTRPSHARLRPPWSSTSRSRCLA